MKKLEAYTQQHTFHDKVKEEISKEGVTIVFTKKSSGQGFVASSVTHYLRAPDPEYTTDGYEALCMADLEAQHIRCLREQISKLLPYKEPSGIIIGDRAVRVAEVRLDTQSTWDADGNHWTLTSRFEVRPFLSPVMRHIPA
jgi:hypothetical protein